MSSVGERIKERRLAIGWTQDKLCTKAGLSKSFLSELENRKRSVSAANLLDIARALNEILLDMQKQIVAHRSAKKRDGLEGVDWQKFYEGVKEFLE